MTVGIVGMGYVGLPLAVAFAQAGHRVVAMDVDSRKVAALERGESYIEDIPSEDVHAVGDLIAPTTRVGPLAHADAVLLCVPTPLTANREPDLGPLLDATRALARVCAPASSSCSSRLPTPGPRASACFPCSRSPAWRRAATSRWRIRQSASIRAASTTPSATRPRSSAA